MPSDFKTLMVFKEVEHLKHLTDMMHYHPQVQNESNVINLCHLNHVFLANFQE